MACRVVVTPRALADLQEIVRFIWRDDSRSARSFARELLQQALALRAWPEIGRAVPELGDPAVREIVHGSNRVVDEFIPALEAIYILKFWHGARGEPSI